MTGRFVVCVNCPVAYYLGIDGGGTKTTCLAGDETAVLATVTTGPSNVNRVSAQVARDSMHQAIVQACAAAGITPSQLKQSCIGIAGAGREEAANLYQEIVGEILPGPFEILGDMEIALHAAFGDGPGIVVVAGTGSIAYGRSEQGISARAGGWGFSVSDEGSAYWIGRRAVIAVLQDSEDSFHNAESRLEKELKTRWNADSLHELARVANSAGNFAELFPAVITAAESSDRLAQKVLTDAGAEVARLAEIVVNKLNRIEPGSSLLPLAMAGGVFRHSPLVRETFTRSLRASHPKISVLDQTVDPAQGALLIARRQAFC